MSAVASSSKMEPVLYREGMLFKRQRGLKTGNAKKLKFQERFCRLTSTSLDYFDPNPKKRLDGPKGQFAVEQIKVAEAMEKDIFGKEYPYAFQIGDSTEVMYFVAKSEHDMEEWLSACRHVAQDGGNLFLSHHHHGVFGLVNKGRWSCCANPRRACPGCSPSTLPSEKKGFTSTLPTMLTPPSKRTNHSSPVKITEHSSRSHTPSHELETGEDTCSSDEEPMVAPPKILVRRFTLADPLMMPGTPPSKLKELRKISSDEKEAELTEEELVLKGAENNSDLSMEKKNNSLNSLNSIDGKEDKEEKEDGDSSKDSVIEVASNGSKGDSSVESDMEKLKELRNQKTKKGDVLSLLANSKERTGASSPSPSVDSGRGVSRPNSQIDVVDLRVSRTESVGKKSVQNVVAEQGAKSDVGKDHTSQQNGTKETDVPSKADKLIIKTEAEIGNSMDHGKEHGKASPALLKSPISVKSPTSVVSPSRQNPGHINRKVSSPPAPDIMYRSVSPESEARLRFSFVETSSESEMSRSVTPQHRKLLAGISGSIRQERPRSVVKGVPSLPAESPIVHSRLHQACKDGNLTVLEEELNKEEPVDLDEAASHFPLPLTPLFIAYINDHYQVMMSLLEHGANPNCEEPCDKASLLQWACEKGCYDIIELLIKYKADVNKQDCFGTTPLMLACRNGHLDVVELLLESGANVDDDSNNQRTALHEATEGEHPDIAELLLKQSEVDPTVRDNSDNTPYDIAYAKKNEELMVMLQSALPREVRPYALRATNTNAASQAITSLVIRDTETIITGSRDCHVKFFSSANLVEKLSTRLTDTVLDMSMFGDGHLILGSTSIQLLDVHSPDRRQIIADDIHEDENLHDPPLHLVRFGPKGRIVTASVENNVIKLWPALSNNTGPLTFVEKALRVGEDRNSIGSIYSICISPNPNSPWLAVSLQPGKISSPEGFKHVFCYDLNTRKLHHIFDAGDGGLGVCVCTTFSPDGKCLAIGCSEHLCIWETRTGNLLQKFTSLDQAPITSLCYSPSGDQLSAGLASGEVQVFEILSSSPVFLLPPTSCPSPVTAVAYSSCGNLFACGHQDGTLRLWEAYGGKDSAKM